MKKKFKKYIEKLKKIGNNTNKGTIIVYIVLRLLVILCMILEFLRGDLNNAFLCVLALILLVMPFFIEKKLKLDLPNTLQIIVMLFIFAAEILGEINNFYGIIPHWDTMLHTLNGFLAAGVGFALFDLLNKNVESISLSPVFLCLVSFCFSMTIGVLWEFFEYKADTILNLDMQKDRIITKINTVKLSEQEKEKISINDIQETIIIHKDKDGNIVETKIENGYLDIGLNDTIKDLRVNFLGALIFSIFGFLYVIKRDKYKFIQFFLPQKLKE